jgi:mono/diheme cytochrome c family protein
MKKLTAARMFDSVKNGKTRMPAFKDKLSDEQIREVIGYFRSQK